MPHLHYGWKLAHALVVQPKVPSVGFVFIPVIGSWIAAYRFMKNPLSLVLEGTAKAKNGMFRISTLQGEYVLVTDRSKVAEYLKAPDTVLNAQDGANDVGNTRQSTMGNSNSNLNSNNRYLIRWGMG